MRGRRLLDFALGCLATASVCIVAVWLWPYLELVSIAGAIIVLVPAVMILDAAWFALRRRSGPPGRH